ncbi:MAG: hypothetical protein KJO31_06710 [Gammaproteobacteria bacterium]|nr:hypothetical protein [Gammaproteobacteria bacterium]
MTVVERNGNTWQRAARLLVAFGIGIAIALYAYMRVVDPEPRMQRAREEAVVREARSILREFVDVSGELQIVDPLAPDRKIGKVFIYPSDGGWEVSGYYRRDDADSWHPWLMQLDGNGVLSGLLVQDSSTEMGRRAAGDKRLTVRQ